ncbi:MAG TPA: hypothetical protein VNK03_07780 [Gammaproteobacteria bacterium]|nr:hypothetical protein [Gammaproteobacteria bacterium]
MDQNLFEFVMKAITSTPAWVWAIFIYLLLVGLKATRNRVIYLPKLYIVPIILIVLKYKIFISGNYFDIAVYILFLCIGLGVGILSVLRTPLKFFKNLKSIELPGSYSTLIVLFLFFSVKYIFGYLQASNPIIANQYAFLELSIEAVFSGYFLGRTLCYTYRLYQ